MIDRILKTYGEVNTTVKPFPPENIKIFLLEFFNFYILGNILCILKGRVFVMLTDDVCDEMAATIKS